MKIKVMVYEPGKPGEVREINDSLEAMQAVVGGYIETVRIASGHTVICNEEGQLLNLPINRWGFVGTFFVTRPKNSGFMSLTEEDQKILKGMP